MNTQLTFLLSVAACALPTCSDDGDTPSTTIPQPTSSTPTAADLEKHAAAAKRRLAGRGFTVVVEEPFVVIGDGSAADVRRRARNTVRWATDRLRAQYFDRNPDHIIDVWLFKDETSYRKHTREFFGDEPSTPFGYYSPHDRALIMNIATGGGTLVHEIVHPFVHANFPECPPWLNEGLGSLYEQCGERDGRIWGYTNWRLAGLQDAIREQRVPSFKSLTAQSESAFYNRDPGTNYSQSRYLCYYLQEHGLLGQYYAQAFKNRQHDPTGYRTLKRVLGNPDMARFQRDWETWVLQLRY